MAGAPAIAAPVPIAAGLVTIAASSQIVELSVVVLIRTIGGSATGAGRLSHSGAAPHARKRSYRLAD